jgi:hypothetical protein
MAKTSGGTRNVPTGSKAHQKRIDEVKRMKESGLYSSVKMYNTGWVAVEKSGSKHSRVEVEASIHLARKGYKVTLTDEGGQLKSPDGKIFNFVYEQRTPNKSLGAKGVQKAIEHARKKVTANQNIDVALIYDKYRRFKREDVEEGIALYEKHNKHRFKRIIIVSSDGNIHIHKHND